MNVTIVALHDLCLQGLWRIIPRFYREIPDKSIGNFNLNSQSAAIIIIFPLFPPEREIMDSPIAVSQFDEDEYRNPAVQWCSAVAVTRLLRPDQAKKSSRFFRLTLVKAAQSNRAAQSKLGGVVGLQISIRESGDVTILDLRGRATINDGESELLKSHLHRLIDTGVNKVLLNLAELRQVDSSCFSIIVKTYSSLRDQGGDLRFLCPRGPAREAFRALRLLEVIPTFEDENEALASFRPQSNFATP